MPFFFNIQAYVNRIGTYVQRDVSQRIGTGSQVLKWCVDFAKKENFKKIKIESVLTESMRNFCMKHQFTKDPATENLNWIKSV